MAFTKGTSGNPNGKPRGSVNKLNKAIKIAILDTFNELQDDPKNNLLAWAKKNPGEFYKIAAKLIPTESRTELTTPNVMGVYQIGYKKPLEIEEIYV